MKRIQPVANMSDETFMRHLEMRHADQLKMRFLIEPGRTERRMRARPAWEAFHSTIHRLSIGEPTHWHGEREDDDG